MGDASRHRSASRRALRIGRRASRTACRRGASHDSRDYRSSRSSVGMPWVTLRVTDLRHTACSNRTPSPCAEKTRKSLLSDFIISCTMTYDIGTGPVIF
ncbi:DUF1534 domain-containing protein [Pseudomonas syringae]|uniref:DUF1534 domain-containing protein n=1 Tax=Pseudomonas syringae TaxID=317 RepID=A0A9Q4A1M8_PSESX|nr:DUF1534 domain-containing protein [Pseudomonas syringae]MCF5474445.1 DUF1534 domain-containing protein [Pseudomonas syringae]MCF5484599.1 DUF1534 domain-containing protein [Pseudomonas syringae]MCF5489662.1 DUF1534 domain-containing protein [Pseudomonas syringae]MCF5493001.1 DUF1534 domain-containing protein [Pseudomonas syringae]